MPKICINVSEKQLNEIDDLMNIEGCMSRSEFFRYLIKFYKHHENRAQPCPEIKEIQKRGKNAELRRYIQKCGKDI